MNDSSAIIVFSQSTSSEDLKIFIDNIKHYEIVLCLSTHQLFAREQEYVINATSQNILFFSFADYISDSEMESCDIVADETIIKEHNIRHEKLLDKYYNEIKKLKNEIIKKNVKKDYPYEKCYVLNDDLGIAKDIWLDLVAENHITHSDFTNGNTKNDKLRVIRRVMKMLNSSCHYVYNGKEKYILLGSYNRINQYFRPTTTIKKASYALNILLAMIKQLNKSKYQKVLGIYLSKNLHNNIFKLFALYYKRISSIPLACTIHEYVDLYGLLSISTGTKMLCLQDGYLPGNYTSRYLRYRQYVDAHLVWDELSKEIFRSNGLSSEISRLFSMTRLSFISVKPIKVKTALIITSGSGDWTALKNRSDEDKLFEVFMEVAKRTPGIHFVFRPHPLWAHHAHQGINSIKRISNYLRLSNLKNMIISSGAEDESREYQQDHSTSRRSLSINEEIRGADIIFGDHSQAIINVAKKGKMIASVNATRRRNLFEGYNRLGFPCFKNASEIVIFLSKLAASSDLVISYNNSVKKYNEEYSSK